MLTHNKGKNRANQLFRQPNNEISTLLAPIIIVVTYLLVGNTDRENYGTTLYPLHHTDSPSPTFLGVRFGDLNLAFGTKFPLLSELQVFFPLFQISSKLLGAVYLGWIFTFSLLIVMSVNRVIGTRSDSIGKWKLVVQLLAVFNPACLDSLFFNDWPGTYFASQISFLVFVNLTFYGKSRDIKRAFLFIYTSSCLVFLADPGYLAITLFGALIVLLCTRKEAKKEIEKKVKGYWIVAISLVSVIAWSYFIDIWNQFWKFSNQNREYSNNSDLVQNVFTILGTGPVAYLPRTSTIYFQVFCILVLVKIVLRQKRHDSGIIHEVRGLVCILVSLLLSLTPEVVFENLFIAPTVNFFFRELAFVFLILLSVQEWSKITNKIIILCNKILVVYLLGSVIIALISKYDSSLPFDDKSWVHRALLTSETHSSLKTFPSSNDRSVGIAISEDAYSQIRNGAIEEIWMPTDLISSDRRLISAVTKVQSKDFFNVSDSPFHASTIKDLDWCDSEIASKYWMDYVLLTDSEFTELGCNTVSKRLDKLTLLQVNSTPGKYETFLKGQGQKEVNCNVELFSSSHSIKVLFNACSDLYHSPIRMNLPLHADSDLVAFENKLDTKLNNEDGFLQVKMNNLINAVEFEITIQPPLHIKIKVVSLWLLHILLFLVVLLKSWNRRKDSCENR